jgi:hypothetical protein
MNGKQLQKVLDQHGLSQRGTARELGINERSMRRYVVAKIVPKVIELAVKGLLKEKGLCNG